MVCRTRRRRTRPNQDGGDVTGQFKIKGKARFPQNVVTGPDGNLWATTGSIHKYRKEAHGAPDKYGAVISMTAAGVMTTHVFDLQMYSDPRDIASGPDGNVWFTESKGAISKITLWHLGRRQLTEFPTPNDDGAFGITVGPDGALWVGSGGHHSGRRWQPLRYRVPCWEDRRSESSQEQGS